jgi:hypothetical protein
MVFLAFFLAPLAWAAPAQPAVTMEDSFVVVESEGVGMTRDEALADARRNAVQRAAGVLSRGVTQTIDDLVRENVIQLSRAFIEKYDIQEERRGGERWTLKIKAWIRGENLLSGLLQEDPNSSLFDGAGLFARALTREQQIKEAAEMLIELFGSVPYENYVRTAVGAEDMNLRSGSGEVALNVRFSFDRERYFTQAVSLFATVLDYVAEAKLMDVPFLLELQTGDPVIITPPSSIASLPQYIDLMELKSGNRYIDIPGAGEFANVYLLKKNYYFDCYYVSSEAFALLMESLLSADGQNRLTGRMFEGADLKIAFINRSGQLVNEHVQPLNLHNVMVFTNLDGFKRSPYTMGKPNQLDAQRHALFILPCIGTMADVNTYLLIENETASISANLPPGDVQQISRADCSIVMRRR